MLTRQYTFFRAYEDIRKTELKAEDKFEKYKTKTGVVFKIYTIGNMLYYELASHTNNQKVTPISAAV
ncbi:unnamed protein product [Caenorhabditis angaria]|uniref:Uncharacterized protein n=1 Tax=Caenorhabditis angaria TaxID=860376 RepID=A0A9P1IDZ4_9PELO|nr:unnamed protein product [Caenorhabditis angaria]